MCYGLWFLLLAMVVRLTVLIRRRGAESFAAVDVYALAEIVIAGMTVILVLVAGKMRELRRRTRGTSITFLVAFLAIGMASAGWSPRPEYSLYRAVEYLSQLLGVFVVFSYARSFQVAEKAYIRISMVTAILCLSIVLKFRGFPLSLAGWHNGAAPAIGAMLLCYCVGEAMQASGRRRRALLAASTFALAIVALCTSATSNIAAACGLASLIVFLGRRLRNSPGSLFLLGAACVAFSLMAGEGSLSRVGDDVLLPGKDYADLQGMTGRVNLWTYYGGLGMQRPILGHGFSVITRVGGMYATGAHNAYLTAFLGTGLVGFTTFCIFLFWLGAEVTRNVRAGKVGSVGCAAALVAGAVQCMAGPFVGEQWSAHSLSFASLLALHTLFIRPARPFAPVRVWLTRLPCVLERRAPKF